jgi:hypothetical protein
MKNNQFIRKLRFPCLKTAVSRSEQDKTIPLRKPCGFPQRPGVFSIVRTPYPSLQKTLFTAAFCAVFSSCTSFGTWFPSKESWASVLPVKGTIAAGKVTADTVSAWESLEREIAGILPLLFLEKGYGFAGEDAPYSADVSLIEREYMEGWQTKRSLSVELRIWDADRKGSPLAAGRAMLAGGKTLASSQVASRLLRLALGEALRALEKRIGG